MRQLKLSRSSLSRFIGQRYMGGGGGHDHHDDHHHGPNLPPFARLRPPTESVRYLLDSYTSTFSFICIYAYIFLWFYSYQYK